VTCTKTSVTAEEAWASCALPQAQGHVIAEVVEKSTSGQLSVGEAQDQHGLSIAIRRRRRRALTTRAPTKTPTTKTPTTKTPTKTPTRAPTQEELAQRIYAACKPVGSLDCDRFNQSVPERDPRNCPDDLSKLKFWSVTSKGEGASEFGVCTPVADQAKYSTPRTISILKGAPSNLAGSPWMSGHTNDTSQMYDSMLSKVALWHPNVAPPNVGAFGIKRVVCNKKRVETQTDGDEEVDNCFEYKATYCVVCPKIAEPAARNSDPFGYNYKSPSGAESPESFSQKERKKEPRVAYWISQQPKMMNMGSDENNKKYIPYPFEASRIAHISRTENTNLGICLDYINRDCESGGKCLFTMVNGTNVIADEYSCDKLSDDAGKLAVKFKDNIPDHAATVQQWLKNNNHGPNKGAESWRFRGLTSSRVAIDTKVF